MSRPPTLTEEQMAVIDDNIDMFPAEIMKLPLFVNDKRVNRNIIRNYQRRQKVEEEPDDRAELANLIKRYMSVHSLPSRFHGKNNVTGFLEFLSE